MKKGPSPKRPPSTEIDVDVNELLRANAEWLPEQTPGAVIQLIREVYQVSRQTFAEWLGIGQTTLYNYEEDIRTPDAATCLKMVILSPDSLSADYFWKVAGLGGEHTSKLADRAAMKRSQLQNQGMTLTERLEQYSKAVSQAFVHQEIAPEEKAFLAEVLAIWRGSSGEKETLTAVVFQLLEKLKLMNERGKGKHLKKRPGQESKSRR